MTARRSFAADRGAPETRAAAGDPRRSPLIIGPVEPAWLREAAARGHLYAVVDPCVDDDAHRWLATLGEDCVSSLYLGEAQANYGDKAPHIVRVDPALLDALPPRFGNAAWGCLIVSQAPPGRVRRHLRGWLSVRSPEGEAWLFRFWDPRRLPTYLRASTVAELDAFFGPITAFATLNAAGEAFVAQRAAAAPAPRRSVGERPTISPAQVAALRGEGMASRLIASFDSTPLAARRDPDSGDVLLRAPDGGITRVHIGADGQIAGTTSPSGRRWTNEHRADGKLARLTTPSGAQLSIGYDASGRVQAVARNGIERFRADHDRYGRMERAAFPDGSDVRLAYALGGASALADPDGAMLTARRDRLGRTERFGYEDGLLTEIVDGNGRSTRIARDDRGRPIGLHLPDGRAETYRYDPQGQLSGIVRAGGVALDVLCNTAGKPVRMRSADGAEASFEYDDAGRLIAATNAAGELRWRYDDLGRVVEERFGDTVVGYEYDAVGLVALTYPDGSTVRYVRDEDQRLSAVRDWTGGWHQIDYAPDDAGWRIASPDGTVATTTTTAVGLVAAQRIEHGGAPLCETRYVHDDEDRLRERHDSRTGAASFDYDAEGQLRRHIRASGLVEDFAYDAAGNRIACAEGAARFDAVNQIIGQGGVRYEHDADGAMIRRITPDADWRFAYDGFGHLIAAEDAAGRRVSFGYDALGRRLWKRVSGNGVDRIIRFVWAGEQMIREEADGAAPRDYLYWPQTYTPLLLRDGDALFHYHCDPAGTPQRLTGGDGSIVWEVDADPFGGVRPRVAALAQPLRMPGQYCDDEFGLALHYNRFRFYDPAIGRYISPDPIGIAGGLNLYGYVGNDPVNRADPLGLWWNVVASVLVAAAVATVVVLTAPISGPLLIIAAGAAAGAAGFMVNEAMTQETFCASCILLAGIRGAAVGAIAALPIAWLPATASVGAFAGLGGVSGFLGYAAEWVMTPGMEWNWTHAAVATGLGAATGGLGRYASGRFGAKPPATADAAAPEPFQYTPKKLGQTEPGAVPNNPKLQAEMDAAANAQARKADGYPDLPADKAATFGDDVRPWDGPDDGTIRRVIGSDRDANGGYWQKDIPTNEAEWRGGSAVLNDWNGNGGYVESPTKGLKGWIGSARPQMSSDGVNVLPGHGEQIWMPPGSADPGPTIPTPWSIK
ncbi:DUF4123 domain-containing protein [Sphingomonas sp. NBWT7]|uniref:DUF4123 domain-containing protein n=1 Tax=Sphingomonas sp. NBWT7 TaxID=2596913 RepID=UPI001625F760|nr:DUF4123 domain-containing protein [Sphingomonas sp. NBWT7]